MKSTHTDSVTGSPENAGLSEFFYRWRWPLSLLLLAGTAWLFSSGAGRVGQFSANVASLADTSNGSGAVKPLFFDPSMDIWFGEEDAAVSTYYEVENTFVAEDFIMVTFDAGSQVSGVASDDEFGVFSRDSLATIARLTERFLTIPGVRHVRSLTYNPWIRWGAIEDSGEDSGVSEEGLIISDLVEGEPAALSDTEIITRMVATLGAERTAARLGEERVRAVLGSDANFADHIGEPLLLGTILDETGGITAIQVQVLRPQIDAERLAATFEDATNRKLGRNLSSIEQQRAAARGIEHFLRMEHGLALPTLERAELQAWVETETDLERKQTLLADLGDPNKNFMVGPDGELKRKFYEYDPVSPAAGQPVSQWQDRTDPGNVIDAPADFKPMPLSSFEYHLGGSPLFERNFEVVGLEDGKYVPLMFLVIIAVLWLVFRSVVGIFVPLAVVFGSILAMVGISFVRGDLLNNLTMMSPNMLTAVSIADAVHLVASWAILRDRYSDKKDLIIEVIRRNALPVFLTSVTTAVGFYSLTVSTLEPVRMLGEMAAIGTFGAWALSMTVVPALLSIVPHKSPVGSQASERSSSIVARLFEQQRSERMVERVLSWRVPVLVVTSVLVAVSMFGLSKVEVDSDFRGMFPDDNPTMSDFQWIEDRMGGVGDLEIVFRGAQNASEEAQVLTQTQEARLQELLSKELGSTQFVDDFSALTNEEAQELAELREKQAAWDARRVGVSPSFLSSLDRFEQRLRQEMAEPNSELALLTDLISPLDTLRKIHQVQHENRAEFYRVPGSEDLPPEARQPVLEYDEWIEEWSFTPAQSASTLVAQYYLQYESGARPGEALWTQLSADRTQFRMQGRMLQDSSVAHLGTFERIEEIARTEFPELAGGMSLKQLDGVDEVDSTERNTAAEAELTLSGKTLLFARTSDMFSRGFVKSMTIALIAITLLIAVIFRSVSYALVSLIPNVLPIVAPLSVFGLLGVPLDGPSILVSSVALGVCVDDTIHFLTKFSRGRRAGMDARSALVKVFTEAGAAMTATTAVLIIGFSTLLLSDFAPNFQMGALAALMIGLAWIADFVVTTAVLSFFGQKGAAESVPKAKSNSQSDSSLASSLA